MEKEQADGNEEGSRKNSEGGDTTPTAEGDA